MNTNLKILVSAIGLAALAASPSFAQTRTVRQPVYQAPATGSTVVAPNGQRIGADPDVAVRRELQRDWPTSTASGVE
jgi:hypothetical protein